MFRLKPIPYHCVRICDSFWDERQRVNHEHSLPKQYDLCKRTGRIEALRLEWTPDSPLHQPHIYWDSDTAKWLEAACYACRIRPDVALREKIDEVAALFVSAQQPDGYLNSHFSVVRPQERWKNLRDEHELYCAGHIVEAAVAHHDLTGNDTLLNTACRLADCIDRTFGTAPDKLRGYCGHEEIELALMRLYHATAEARYLRLASYFIDERGRQPLWFETEHPPIHGLARFPADYYQAHKPVREQSEAVGHAVRAMYLYTGMIDVAAATLDSSLREACQRLWDSVTRHKLYITGGIGSSWSSEAFTENFDLPNERAYCETCGSVALAFWARRMLQLEGDATYAEVLERVLYNGALAGMSLDGQKFFYQNPLTSLGQHSRQEWFECSCCPSNLSRLLGTLGESLASTDADTLLIHLYVGSEIPFSLTNGAAGSVRFSGDLPWGGSAQLELSLACESSFPWELRIRVPSWVDQFRITINGTETPLKTDRGYACLRRTWRDRDKVELTFDVPVRQLTSDPRVTATSGHVALQRGPFIYCIEDADFPDLGGVLPVALSREDAQALVARFDADLLDGIVVLEGVGKTSAELETPTEAIGESLYRSAPAAEPRNIPFRAIPYFAWSNREQGAMRVWIPRQTG